MRDYTIEAIPTRFDGIEYRSRLEAKWAAFLHYSHITFSYEKKLFKTSEGYYLPDVALLKCPFDMIEFKFDAPTTEEIAKCYSVSQQGYKIAIFAGYPWPGEFEIDMFNNGIHSRPVANFRAMFQYKRLNKKELLCLIGLRSVLGNHNFWKGFTQMSKIKWKS